MAEHTCDACGATMESYTVFDKDTGERVGARLACPNEWRMSHR
jgi:hypothetical protein